MVFDDSLLDDPARLADADTSGVLRAAAMSGAQVRSVVERAAELELDARLDVGRARSLVLVGRSGVGRAVMRLLAALLGPSCPSPVVLADVVPSWVGALDVVYAHTDDPGDDELASSLARASRYGAAVVLTAPEEGPVATAVAGRGTLLAPRVVVGPDRIFPTVFTVGLRTLSALDLLDVDFDALADELDAEAERDHLQHESFVNPAKSLALSLADRTPLLWGLDPVAGAVAEHAAYLLAAEAAVVADATDYRHAFARSALYREVSSGSGGRDIFADPDDPDTLVNRRRLLLLSVRQDAAATATRRAATEVFSSADVVDIVDEIGAAEPVAAAVLALRFELAAVYLGLGAGTIGGANRFTPVQS
ncbi:SIS domain-containing protein [Haloechinothrix halophila]|uniref:SIS domain-containing protein n=1 Tax=Haloechinothrix halophila TaxID=1069073 RepID=UPI0005539612|nr:SIS domain-containing protein [Haloechinothrix halophila]